MQSHLRLIARPVLATLAAPALLFVSLAAAQSRPVPPQPPSAAAPVSDQDLEATQDQLIKLLRLSPTLTSVVANDPSLLANQEYVSRNNPQLAQFLAVHPEVVRNPEFYLFTRVDSRDGRRSDALQREVWPDVAQLRSGRTDLDQISDRILEPLLAAGAFICILGALLWLIHQFIENRRWGRIFKLQSEVHARLIDKFGSTQELAAYMGTEAGRRFLEAAPIPVGFEPEQRMPNAVARMLMPLQIGIVLSLLGAGLLLLRNVRPEMDVPMLVIGTVVLMPGLGFIISAGITWLLAGRLGLIPDNSAAANRLSPPSDAPSNFQERQ
jgi:hypothetical protein